MQSSGLHTPLALMKIALPSPALLPLRFGLKNVFSCGRVWVLHSIVSHPSTLGGGGVELAAPADPWLYPHPTPATIASSGS